MDIISNNSHGHTNSFHRIKILINLTKHEGSAICEDVPPHSFYGAVDLGLKGRYMWKYSIKLFYFTICLSK